MDKFTREEIRKEIAKQPSYTRNIVVGVIGEKAKDTEELFQQEELEFYVKGNPVSLKWLSTKVCSGGHLLGPDCNAFGLCQIPSCKAVVCDKEGCGFTCGRCGRTICARHAHIFKDGEVACPRCKLRSWLRRIFW